MDKKTYELLKRLRRKSADGTATFQERLILRMEEKRRQKAERNKTTKQLNNG